MVQVWPGAVHYPDFTHPRSQQWWQEHLSTWHEKLPFDGLWIDMNEVSNFCTGDVCEVHFPIQADHASSSYEADSIPRTQGLMEKCIKLHLKLDSIAHYTLLQLN
jgi:alpha-glucosidase (family GH31 glycosyl hydrolase)